MPSRTDDPLDNVREALRALDRQITHDRGDDFMAQCPAHADRTPSLHVSRGRDSGAVMCCHARCDIRDICAELGIGLADLFPRSRPAFRARTQCVGSGSGRSSASAVTDFCEQCGQVPAADDRVIHSTGADLWLCGVCYDAIFIAKNQRPRTSPRSPVVTSVPEGSGTQAQAQTEEANVIREQTYRASVEVERDEGAEPQLWELLRAHREEGFMPEPFEGLGPLPPNPSRAERAAYELIRLCFGLRLADGTTEPLLFARSVLVQTGIVRTVGGASKLLCRFEALGVWWCVGRGTQAREGERHEAVAAGPSPGRP